MKNTQCKRLIKVLDLTFGKTVELKDFFPDIDKFIWSVVSMQKVVSYEALCKKKRFRLKKILAKLWTETRALQKCNVQMHSVNFIL